MVLVLLVLMWVVVLTPSLLRSRSRRRGDSIGSFRRQLGVIQRTAPAVIPAANRRLVEPAPAAGRLADMGGARDVAVGTAWRAGGLAAAMAGSFHQPGRLGHQPGRLGHQGGTRPAGAGVGPAGSGGGGPARSAGTGRPSLRAVGSPEQAGPGWPGRPVASGVPGRETRARTLQRRRQVLVGLVGTVGFSLVLGVVPALRMLWVLTGISALALAGYVALLVRMRNLAAEKEMKLRFLPRPSDPSLLLRRSAN